MTVEEALARLRDLATRAAQGEDVTQQRQQIEAQLAALGISVQATQQPQPQPQPQPQAPQPGTLTLTPTAPAPTGVVPGPQSQPPAFAAPLSDGERAEYERLRAEAEQRNMQALADSFAGLIEQRHAQHQEQTASAMAQYIQQALGQRGLVPANGQDPMLQQAVLQALTGMRGGSRFPSGNADPQALKHLANGGTFGNQPQAFAPGAAGGVHLNDPSALQGGEDREVKAIEDSKSLGTLMSIVARAHKAPWTVAEHEMRFMRKISAKAMAQGTPSAGGILVPEEWMPDMLDVIRAEAVVRRAQPRVIPFNKQMNQTSVSTGATAYYVQENARITPSELTFAQTPILTPKYLTALVPVSNYLLQNADAVDTLVRDDMVSALVTREDLAFLQGTGTGGEPTGFRNLASVILNPIAPGTNGFVPTLPDFRKIKGRTRLMGVSNPRWTWFFHPAVLTFLERLVDTTGKFLVDSGILTINADGVSGTFDGLPFFASYQIPTTLTLGTSTDVTYVLLINMSEAILGESIDMQIDVSSEATYSPDGGTTHISAFQQNQTVFRVVMGHDINHRAPARGVIDQEGIRIS